MSEWELDTIKNATTKVGSGATPTGGGETYKLNGTALIRSQNVLDFEFSKAGLAYIDDIQAYGLRNVTIEKDDVLLNITGDSVARCCMVPQEILPARVNQHVAILRAKRSKCLPEYLKYNMLFQKESLLSHSEVGATRRALTKSVIEALPLLLPPLPEQEAITEVLSSLDDKIDLLIRNNRTLELMAATLFYQWFEKGAQDSWTIGKLSDIIVSIESGSRPKGGIDPALKNGIPSIGAESINGIGNFDFAKTKYVTPEFYKKMNRGVIRDYDVLIYKDGAYIGRKGMFGKGFPFKTSTVNEHVFILRSNDTLNQFFLYFLLREEALASLNSNSAQPGLNQEALKSFEISIPPREMIFAYGNTVKPWVDKILENSKQMLVLSKLRDTLLPKLMSGEVKAIN